MKHIVPVIILLTMLSSSSIPAQEVPAPVGLWKFDNAADLNHATIGADLEQHLGHSAQPGISEGDGAIYDSVGAYLRITPNIPANGGGTMVNKYTFVCDFKVPSAPGKYYAFFQTDPANGGNPEAPDANNDADCWIEDSSAVIGSGGESNGGGNGNLGVGVWSSQAAGHYVRPNVWYRLVVAADLGSGCRYYVDGELWANGDGRTDRFFVDCIKYAIRGIGTGNSFLVFADNSSEDNGIFCSLLALYNVTLNETQVAELGVAGDPIPGDSGEGEGELSVSVANGPVGWLEEGDRLELSVAVDGATPPVEYQWLLNGTPIDGATEPEYVKEAVALSDAGVYRCRATDSYVKTVVLSDPVNVEVFPAGSLPVAGGVGGAIVISICMLGGGWRLRKRRNS